MQYSGTPLIKIPMGQVFIEVSLFARIVLGLGKGVLLVRCPLFRGVFIEWFHCIQNQW